MISSSKIGTCTVKNKIIRSATFEGMCDNKGFPTTDYYKVYEELAKNNAGSIITGFTYISPEGKAIQPGQAGLDSEDKIEHYLTVTQNVHKYGSKIFMQLAHTGRQTRKKETGFNVVGAEDKKSIYFGGKVVKLSTKQVYEIAEKFAQSAFYAKKAGFDGIQIHAAHGYLIHQFILPSINNRKDEFGINKETGIGTKFLDVIIDRIRAKCGHDYCLLVKISGGDDYNRKFSLSQFKNLLLFLQSKKVSAIEISYGTMDFPLSIMRGSTPLKTALKHNLVFGVNKNILRNIKSFFLLFYIMFKTKPYTSTYNIEYAKLAKKIVDIPIISVGGFRSGKEIQEAIDKGYTDFVSFCRPFICEPDFAKKLEANPFYVSKCTNCNMCAVMCDSENKTMCYGRRKS